jgi:uncharacterized protein (DUF2141 family)
MQNRTEPMNYCSTLILALAIYPSVSVTQTEATCSKLGTLHARITGFKSVGGELAAALFDSAATYQDQSNPVRRAFLPVDSATVEWTLEGLPPASYALIVYHDENGNREIDMRVLGMPKEPVGVSNNARGLFGPPRFEAARFEICGGTVTQEIRLR